MTDPEKFRYQLPEDSPNRWGGLSQSAREAVTGVTAGPTPADVLLQDINFEGDITHEAGEWVIEGLQQTLKKWRPYEGIMSANVGVGVPGSVQELAAEHVDFSGTMSRLVIARTALQNSGENNLKGKNLGDTMRLVLVPWEQLRFGLEESTFNNWIRNFYDVKNQATVHGANDMLGLMTHTPFYRNPNGSGAPRLTAHEYLWRKISSDGPWGIMLAQVDGRAGATNTAGRSPAELTDLDSRLSIAGQYVDDMGILEWVSLTLQENPRQFPNRAGSYLLANMGEVTVPYGSWDIRSRRLLVSPQSIDSQAEDCGPRLAVL